MDLKAILESPVRFKIISFFNENPASIDTAKGIATWINHNVEEVERALEDLVKRGLLSVHSGTSTIGYVYTQDKKIVSQIKKILRKQKVY